MIRLAFDEPWQARAFGVCVALLERRGEPWEAFRSHLVRAIEDAPGEPYYETFVTALEAYAGAV